MNIATGVFACQPAGVSVVRDIRGLDSFLERACAAAIWERAVPSEMLAWLARLDAEKLPSGRVVLPVHSVRKATLQLCDIAGMPEGTSRDWLVDDIALLALRFAELMETSYVRLRLQAVTTNACRKFHLDALTGRLICTYRGAATQYGISTDGEHPRQIFTAPTGSPILLRGSLWRPEPSSGLLHRSPPIEGTGETRLVLVLDPVVEMEAAE